jgi:hypothetical protein
VALRHFPAIAIKDLLSLAAWIAGWFRQRVEWRGNALRLARGSVLLPLPRMVEPDLAPGLFHDPA